MSCQKIECSEMKIYHHSSQTKKGKSFCEIRIDAQDRNFVSNQDLQRALTIQSRLSNQFLIKNYSQQSNNRFLIIFQEPYLLTLQSQFCKSLPYSLKIEIFQQIVKGVQQMHTCGIINLGLRPNRIAVIKKGQRWVPQIIALTEALLLSGDQDQHPFSLKKIYGHYAPQINFKGICTTYSDIWSLGYLLYCMLFGTDQGIKMGKFNGEIVYPMGTPEWLQLIINGMLEHRIQDRFRVCDILNRVKFMKQCSEVADKMIPTKFQTVKKI